MSMSLPVSSAPSVGATLRLRRGLTRFQWAKRSSVQPKACIHCPSSPHCPLLSEPFGGIACTLYQPSLSCARPFRPRLCSYVCPTNESHHPSASPWSLCERQGSFSSRSRYASAYNPHVPPIPVSIAPCGWVNSLVLATCVCTHASSAASTARSQNETNSQGTRPIRCTVLGG
ncbi:hypothetical protein MPH_03564 [Macrophomina phaseolina MS6]|uniref:Uncharacterized protein n=1 Tax=Macrophomina phaseolina (strain MS6) TaxID=1126212 RepID=K2S9S9_MACPH|nr:hypothetical protein MPH_03564 [Macrophomina phaseolina MS6]